MVHLTANAAVVIDTLKMFQYRSSVKKMNQGCFTQLRVCF